MGFSFRVAIGCQPTKALGALKTLDIKDAIKALRELESKGGKAAFEVPAIFL